MFFFLRCVGFGFCKMFFLMVLSKLQGANFKEEQEGKKQEERGEKR